ncbi:MAG: hypothetical protein GOVbin1753_20 [Prokaryotic dsDNA virus sp.]|nr:MAG: hypothetical protein GOVbin1753_20 [Prokaryotic dsDNA virus sp.]|tara:strand:+ start:12963 stop:15557 length:2595 start_codon:yes stop_codon:yes gene_type:complete
MSTKLSKNMVNDYISLEWPKFEEKYDDKKYDLDSFMSNIADADFDESHIAPRHSSIISETQEKSNVISSIRDELFARGFDSQYISGYMNHLNKIKPEDVVINAVKRDILTHFLYKEKKMTIADLRQELSTSEITTVGLSPENKKAIEEQIKLYINQLPDYEQGLNVLLSELEEISTDVEYTPISQGINSITRISPQNKEEREEIYEFYEEQHNLFTSLKKIIKEVLEIWDDVQEDVEEIKDDAGEVTNTKSQYRKKNEEQTKQGQRVIVEETVEELDSELERLMELYNDMDDDMNYVLKTGLIPYSIITDRDISITSNIDNQILRTIAGLLGKKAVERFVEEAEEEDFYEIDEGTYQNEAGEKVEEKPQPKAEVTFEDRTEEDIELDELLDGLDSIEVIEEVDPLFIIAVESGIIKNKYSISSWKKTKKELNNRLEDARKNNPGVASIYQTAIDEHEQYLEQAYEKNDSRNDFYIPISEASVSILRNVSRDIDIPIDKISSFHEKMVKVIIDLLEDPLERSTLPIHSTMDDFAPGKEQAGKERLPSNVKQREEMKEQFNLFERLKVGKKGKKRNEVSFGKFTESLIELFEIADKYYGDPVREDMIPYKTAPKYLDMDTLSPLINHGPENVAQITLGLYRDYYHSSITARDLAILTDYMITNNRARKNVSDLEKKADKVLDVLEKINPGNKDNDVRWFANQFKIQAKKDSSFDIRGVQLDQRRIENIDYDKKKHRTSYHSVLKMIYKFGNQFKKNPYIAKQYERFEDAYRNQSDMKLASVAQTKILEAHDEIRKMMNKPIYYNTCDLDNFNHINDTIDIMKEQYRVELTGSDITGIVNEFDSMETIAKRYGVNSNLVYHVKAMYR